MKIIRRNNSFIEGRIVKAEKTVRQGNSVVPVLLCNEPELAFGTLGIYDAS